MSEIRLYRKLVEAGKQNQPLLPNSDRIDIYPATGAIEAHVSIYQRKNHQYAAHICQKYRDQYLRDAEKLWWQPLR